jgi:hypothetical protein
LSAALAAGDSLFFTAVLLFAGSKPLTAALGMLLLKADADGLKWRGRKIDGYSGFGTKI